MKPVFGEEFGLLRMKVAHNNKFIIMHIPKCAGTALRLMIEEHCGSNALVKLYSMENQFGKPDKPITGYSEDFVIGHFGVDYFKDQKHSRKAITFIRDPIDRVLSHYYYWRSTELSGIGAKLAKCLSLADFLKSDLLAVRRQISNLQTWMFVANIDMLNRHKLACASQDELFDLARKNLEHFDFVGTTESFDTDLRFLNDKYSWGAGYSLTAANVTKKRKYLEDLDDETVDLLRGVTALDRRFYRYIKKYVYPQQFIVGNDKCL